MSWVLLVPPRSFVRHVPSANTFSTACSSRSANDGNWRCRSIIAEDNSNAVGFAVRPWTSFSFPTFPAEAPCSKTACSAPTFPAHTQLSHPIKLRSLLTLSLSKNARVGSLKLYFWASSCIVFCHVVVPPCLWSKVFSQADHVTYSIESLLDIKPQPCASEKTSLYV
jgi:hypothetical protein